MDAELLDQCFDAPLTELEPLFEEAFKLSRARFSNRIHFYLPGMVHFDTPFYKASNQYRFPSVSITGSKCQLQCEHCKAKLLETMIPAVTPKRLYEVCSRIREEGGSGCLISGGSQKDGAVPLMEFIPMMKRIKRELELDLVVHTGVVSPELADALAGVGVDAAMLDVIGSNDTIKSVYHLDLTVGDLDRSLSLLEQSDIPIVPHLVVGLQYGRIEGERRALQIISKHRLGALVVVAFMPLEQTPMEHVAPSSPLDIARVILASRFTMPDTPLLLGCARPRGEHKSETDTLAIRAGVNGIAYPSREGYDFAREKGLTINFSEECCALMYRDFNASFDGPPKNGGSP